MPSQNLPDSENAKGLSPKQPAPTPGPDAGQRGPVREKSSPNDNG
jgi:hypothetical protein